MLFHIESFKANLCFWFALLDRKLVAFAQPKFYSDATSMSTSLPIIGIIINLFHKCVVLGLILKMRAILIYVG